ncbi:uncharacterized protein EV154DRAFT_570520 [Mucor mucedo]|uniref:uncharacterized protein n=1 Tax=Mucor mucedo TaxID=29922 RepID=UPI002220A25C|nr:uncharacterized protein EV154DRAFT_570520 [Mucor mucedo]KAI7872228.1 hypothetical protein EV154DRAFT_570520 [Mucor mucedo]
MNNTEANNNAPNNVRGPGRGRGNEHGGRRRRGRRAGNFVFVVDPTVQQNTTPVNNGNTEAGSNANVDDDDEPEQLSSRSYNVWPNVAICILLEIMDETMAENASTDVLRAFLADISETSMQRKWADMKQSFTRVRNAARETGVGGTVPNMPYYEEIAKITQDNSSIQPEVIYESINMEESISRTRQIALEDIQARRRQETRERYRMFEEVRSRREADMEEHRRRRMSDMETILNRFAVIRRGDSDTNLNGSSSTDNNH